MNWADLRVGEATHRSLRAEEARRGFPVGFVDALELPRGFAEQDEAADVVDEAAGVGLLGVAQGQPRLAPHPTCDDSDPDRMAPESLFVVVARNEDLRHRRGEEHVRGCLASDTAQGGAQHRGRDRASDRRGIRDGEDPHREVGLGFQEFQDLVEVPVVLAVEGDEFGDDSGESREVRDSVPHALAREAASVGLHRILRGGWSVARGLSGRDSGLATPSPPEVALLERCGTRTERVPFRGIAPERQKRSVVDTLNAIPC